jgi:hypothetical protein
VAVAAGAAGAKARSGRKARTAEPGIAAARAGPGDVAGDDVAAQRQRSVVEGAPAAARLRLPVAGLGVPARSGVRRVGSRSAVRCVAARDREPADRRRRGVVHVEDAVDPLRVDRRRAGARTDDRQVAREVEVAAGVRVVGGAGQGEPVDASGDRDGVGPRAGLAAADRGILVGR